MPDLGSAVVPVHGDAAHSQTYVHLGGTITETITGLKTFSSVAKFVDGTATAPGITFTTENALGLYRVGAGELGLAATAGVTLVNGASGAYARIFRDGTIGGALGLGLNGTLDAYLYREAAAYLLMRNGVNAQRFGVARTYTDASNYEVGEIGWSGTTFRVGSSHAGTGAARSMALLAGGSERWTVDGTAGHLTAVAGTEQIRWGTTASFPMLKRNAVTFGLEVRLADDSAYGALTAGSFISKSDMHAESGAFSVIGAGPHYIHPAGRKDDAFFTVGAVSPSGSVRLLTVNGTLNPAAGLSADLALVGGTIVEAASGVHNQVSGLRVGTLTLTDGAGATTAAASFIVEGAPTGATENYAAWIKGGSVRFGSAGPHAIGGVLSTNVQLFIDGTFTGTAAGTAAVRLNSTVVAGAGGSQNAHGLRLTPTLVTIADTAHARFSALDITAPAITINGTATITNAATVYISDQPTGGIANYALWIDAGRVRWDDAVALGGGAAPTFGTIGGSGPTAAAQNQWLRVNIAGSERFIPVWA